MKRKSIQIYYLSTLLILCTQGIHTAVFADNISDTAIAPQSGNNATPPAPEAKEQEDKLGLLEKKLFLQQAPQKTEDERLGRLELFVFGSKGNGDSKARLEKLERALPADKNAEALRAPGTKTPISKPLGLLQIINSGIDNYNRHRYHNAEDDFELACAMAPGMSRVHAYMAVTKLQINERQSALDAFRTCYELDPFGTYGQYAKRCLIELAGDEAVRQKGPVDSNKILDGAIEKIDRQSQNERGRHAESGASLSQLRTTSGKTQVNKLYDEIYGSPWESPSNQLIQRSNYARTDSYAQAMKAASDATARASFTAESANNLKHLMASKPLYGGARLRAWGTNLNARYYGRETWNLAPAYIPREHPVPLKAAPLSLKKNSPAKKAKPRSVKTNTSKKAPKNSVPTRRKKAR